MEDGEDRPKRRTQKRELVPQKAKGQEETPIPRLRQQECTKDL